MYDPEFYYKQYDAVDWAAQVKTELNKDVYANIISKIERHSGPELSLFDMGFGVGVFFSKLYALSGKFERIHLAGCEPSQRSYRYFKANGPKATDTITLETYNLPFSEVRTERLFDFLTSVYVLPNFPEEAMPAVVDKAHSMLKANGIFAFAVTDFNFIKGVAVRHPDKFLEDRNFEYRGKTYRETLHWTELQGIGRIQDYNREREYYLNLLADRNFKFIGIDEIDSDGFEVEIYYFQKI